MSEGYGHVARITVSGKWCLDCMDRVYGVHMCSPVDGSKAVPDFLYKFLLAASIFHQLERIHSIRGTDASKMARILNGLALAVW